MKIVIAIDSFKGSMSSALACETVKRAALDVFEQVEVLTVPIADGGEGTVDSLCSKKISTVVTGPLGDKTIAEYGIFDSHTAVIEIAAAAGLPLIPEEKRDPMHTTTYGVGELIIDAIKNGCDNFIIGLGGSCTNDGGIGMLSALGYRFLDKNNREIKPCALGLRDLEYIDDSNVYPELSKCTFNIACDVENPLCGELGCSRVFAPQKGANSEQIEMMDKWLARYAKLTEEKISNSDSSLPGSGAAGGLGFAFSSYLNAVLSPGIDIIIKHTKLENKIVNADFVITGEGRIDAQTIMGKTPIGVAKVCKKYNIPVIAFCGCTGDGAHLCNENGIDAYFPIISSITDIKTALKEENAVNNLYNSARQVFLLIKTLKKV